MDIYTFMQNLNIQKSAATPSYIFSSSRILSRTYKFNFA